MPSPQVLCKRREFAKACRLASTICSVGVGSSAPIKLVHAFKSHLLPSNGRSAESNTWREQFAVIWSSRPEVDLSSGCTCCMFRSVYSRLSCRDDLSSPARLATCILSHSSPLAAEMRVKYHARIEGCVSKVWVSAIISRGSHARCALTAEFSRVGEGKDAATHIRAVNKVISSFRVRVAAHAKNITRCD